MACEFVARFGLVADQHQRAILEDWLAVGADGKWAAQTCGLAEPRQNGKNAALEIREVFGAAMLGEKVLHTAHELKTSKRHFRRLQKYFGREVNDAHARFPELNKLVIELRRANGDEAIYLANGGSIELGSRSTGGSRGWTVDVIVYDEAQSLNDALMEATLSAHSAAPLGNPQTLFTGTPPGPLVQGSVFRRIRQSMLVENPSRRSWFEWSAEGQLADLDLDSRELWAECNPALGTRIDWDSVIDERANLSDAGFARERLGWWGPPELDNMDGLLIDPAKWAEFIADTPQGVQPDAIGLDMSSDRLLAVAMCVIGDDGAAHVELNADYVADPRDAFDWLVKRCARRKIPVLVDAYSGAAELVAPLKAADVNVHVVYSGREMATACGLFFSELDAGRVTHAGQPVLLQALMGAQKRPIKGADGFGLDRRDPSENISPAVAVVLARFGASMVKRKPKAAKPRRGSVM